MILWQQQNRKQRKEEEEEERKKENVSMNHEVRIVWIVNFPTITERQKKNSSNSSDFEVFQLSRK